MLACLLFHTQEVWQAVRQATGKSKPTDTIYPVDADTLNQHFANISTDKSYQMPLLKATVDKFTTFFSEEYVFHLLDTVRPSVTGLDKISSWFLRISAPLISVPTAYIFNTSRPGEIKLHYTSPEDHVTTDLPGLQANFSYSCAFQAI